MTSEFLPGPIPKMDDGQLTPAGQILEIPTPVCLRFVPLS